MNRKQIILIFSSFIVALVISFFLGAYITSPTRGWQPQCWDCHRELNRMIREGYIEVDENNNLIFSALRVVNFWELSINELKEWHLELDPWLCDSCLGARVERFIYPSE